MSDFEGIEMCGDYITKVLMRPIIINGIMPINARDVAYLDRGHPVRQVHLSLSYNLDNSL